MSFLPVWLIEFAEFAERVGLPAILSLICLLQYATHLYYRYATRNREVELLSNLESLEGEMSEIQRDRYLTRIENGILREIFASTATGRAVELLLKKFVPNSAEGFVIFFCAEHQRLEIFMQRGLTAKTAAQITLDTAWIEQVLTDRFVRISPADLASSQFASVLSSRERRKINELYLFAVTDHNEVFGIIATTALFPPCVDLKNQQELVSRILESVTGSLRQTMQLVDQQHLLKLTQEKLALRSIADRHYDSPAKLLDDYLARLLNLVEADRGSLLLLTQNKSTPFRVISRQGTPLQAGLEGTWREHEMTLAHWAISLKSPCSLSSAELSELGIVSLLGSALVLPLKKQSRTLGLLLLARRDHGIFTSMHINLADWAAAFLAETLLRVLDRVEIERAASLDGLTELANRRTFDSRILKELDNARTAGQECSLCLVDLDNFKKTNDTFGHQAGDEVLKQFSRLLEQETRSVRSTDVPLVARYGGEEMAILLPGVGLAGAMRIGESIRAAAEKAVVLHNRQRIPVTVSIGVSVFPRHAQTVESLIQTADKALYRAKHEGRNTVRSAGAEDPRNELQITAGIRQVQ